MSFCRFFTSNRFQLGTGSALIGTVIAPSLVKMMVEDGYPNGSAIFSVIVMAMMIAKLGYSVGKTLDLAEKNDRRENNQEIPLLPPRLTV